MDTRGSGACAAPACQDYLGDVDQVGGFGFSQYEFHFTAHSKYRAKKGYPKTTRRLHFFLSEVNKPLDKPCAASYTVWRRE